MEVVDETMGSNDQSTIIKGRRTKRQRPSSPLSITMSTSSSTAAGHEYTYMSGESTEEEDMANCLIMLAQGQNPKQFDQENDKKLKESVTTATSPPSFGRIGGVYVYECKTCNRCFPSFQALGGHRASHKKAKAVVEEKKAILLYQEDIQFNNNNNTSSPPPPPPHASFIRNGNTNKSSKVHECSICGSEFSSGQALGGHMRRHRTSTTTKIESEETKTPTPNPKPRHVFALDLNLPAPEEDQQSNNNFVFSNQPSTIYSASSLVDCHY